MKSNNIIVRKALPQDAPDWAVMLLKLDEEVVYTTFQPGERSSDISKYKDKIISAINYPKSAIFLAFDTLSEDNNVVGYLSVEAYRNNRKSHVATIGIGILESYSSQGIANQLFIEMIDHAKRNNLRRIEGHVAQSNYKSIALTQKFGFITEGIKRNAIKINDAYEDEHLMVLEIEVLHHGQ
ncbi:GNAT family N-acetyltransferase [Legionella shakespearei]|uniref:Putative acetyltransferase YhhY n=1 Tax=Legionella shakespearei DSM 23087 TaxID=1122169 RepID=A0A0W0YS06_9GAMM|nr:GNAT family protein [Legionella shakespearei]KTD59286.1 putative acetyltransferase YhhY [Legionella shakespearei DSM 23087]